jgi:hypothetical protein
MGSMVRPPHRLVDAVGLIDGSTLLRSHGVEVSEHRLDRPAVTFRTRRVRVLVLGDMFLTLENLAAFFASEFIGRHSACLHANVRACTRVTPRPRRRPGGVYALRIRGGIADLADTL